MDADAILRLILYFVLIFLSGFFSGSETALFSLGPVQLMRLAEEGHPRSGLLQRLLGQPRRLIATIFIGNELVNVGASALMASLTHRYLGGHGQTVVAVVSTCISVALILLLGEITPKNLAIHLGESWALRAARPIWLLAAVMAPLRWGIERIADAAVKLVGERVPAAEVAVGEDEFRTMVDLVSRDGDLDQREQQLIHNVFEFGDRRVTDVMTPADGVFALSADLPLEEVIAEVQGSHYSRIPIFRGHPDRIVGILFAKDLIPYRFAPVRQRWQGLLHTPLFVPRATKCDLLFREFRRLRSHLAIVVDEYGRMSGLVTMEDLLEEMFGEIRDEKELAQSRPSRITVST